MSRNYGYLILILLLLATVVLVGCENDDELVEVPIPQAENSVPTGQATNLENVDGDLDDRQESLTLGNFTVTEAIESFDDFTGNPVDLITLEAAVDIGVNFILDVLNQDLEGLYLLMIMQHNPWINRSSWIGIVTPSAIDSTEFTENFDFDDQLFTFLIDAVTGERYNISDNTPNAWLRENSGSRDLSEAEMLALFPAPTADEIIQLEAIAHDVAERFFLGSNVQDVGIDLMFGNGGGSPISHFWATDDAGRQIEIAIIRELGQVWFITNPDSLTPN